MKKLLILVLLVAMLVPVVKLPTGAKAQDTVTLEWWDNQQTPSGLSQSQQAAVDEFTTAFPNIQVNVTTVPYNAYRDQLITAVQGGTAPDISTVDQIWNSEFAVAEAIIPLDDYIAQSETVKQENFFPGAWDSTVWEDQVWGVPFNIDVWQFTFYNQDLLDAAGVAPEDLVTWDGFKAAAEKLTNAEEGQYGVGLVGARGEIPVVIMDSFIYSNGGSVLNDDGTCALTEPEAIEALQYLVDLTPYAPEGVANLLNDTNTELFLNGSLATMWWPALVQPTLQASDINWGLVAGTAPEGMKPIGTLGGWSLVIYESSEHKDEAFQFIEYLTRPEINIKVVDLVPANIEAAEQFLNENREAPEVIMQHILDARPRPLSPVYPDVSSIQQDLAQAMFTGTSVEEAAAVACENINALLEE
jgi:ABC-type glycerol-3-phosphate transport system substrate-binding protein